MVFGGCVVGLFGRECVFGSDEWGRCVVCCGGMCVLMVGVGDGCGSVVFCVFYCIGVCYVCGFVLGIGVGFLFGCFGVF